MYKRLVTRRCCAALLVLLLLAVIIALKSRGFWEDLGFDDRGETLILDLLVMIGVTVVVVVLAIVVFNIYDRSPRAKVDRLLYRVLQEAGECDAQSVTFVLNDIDRSLYVDIDERIVVFPCHYNLTPQLGHRIVAKHNVIPYRLNDGISYAYFLTPTSAKVPRRLE